MVDPFVMALDALFASSMAMDAIYYAGDGFDPLPVRTIRSQPDQPVNFGDGQIILSTNLFELRRSEVPEPRANDTLTIGDEVYALQGDARIDVEGLTWTCPADLA